MALSTYEEAAGIHLQIDVRFLNPRELHADLKAIVVSININGRLPCPHRGLVKAKVKFMELPGELVGAGQKFGESDAACHKNGFLNNTIVGCRVSGTESDARVPAETHFQWVWRKSFFPAVAC
jgi:hypothetical protein